MGQNPPEAPSKTLKPGTKNFGVKRRCKSDSSNDPANLQKKIHIFLLKSILDLGSINSLNEFENEFFTHLVNYVFQTDSFSEMVSLQFLLAI